MTKKRGLIQKCDLYSWSAALSVTEMSPVRDIPSTKIYLAQASIGNLPSRLQGDVPTPGLVLTAGKGDLYDSSIWLGLAPTYTPLHRDPNPNLFVQLAGQKVVRLFEPSVGRAILASVHEQIGSTGSATIRGEEMMQGAEGKALLEAVWSSDAPYARQCSQADLGPGDALYIPKGWWHSVRGIGSDMTGSVSPATKKR
jgi:hypothetical protein